MVTVTIINYPKHHIGNLKSNLKNTQSLTFFIFRKSLIYSGCAKKNLNKKPPLMGLQFGDNDDWYIIYANIVQPPQPYIYIYSPHVYQSISKSDPYLKAFSYIYIYGWGFTFIATNCCTYVYVCYIGLTLKMAHACTHYTKEQRE